MNNIRKNNQIKTENEIIALSERCHELYHYKSKLYLFYFGDTESVNFIVAIMASVCLLNRKT